MCGIIGYSGSSPAFPFLFEGLKRLEYRGYDSVGVCISGKVVKMKGHVDGLKGSEVFLTNCGNFGIGHTRWATHGEPSFVNAHPHSSNNIHIVHNGIIENHAELKEELTALGYGFVTETDTECAAHLIRHHYSGDLLSALIAACGRLKGSFALAVVSDREGEIAAARRESPLAVGRGETGIHLASDVSAIADKCDKLYLLGDGEFVFISDGEINFYDASGERVEKEAEDVDRSYETVSMCGYSTFMEKEIEEGARAVADTARGLKAGALPQGFFGGIERIVLCACGTAYHACCYGKKLIERFARLPVSAEIASELSEPYTAAGEETLFVFVSQSGETADTLAAHALAKRLGSRTLAVTNVAKSALEGAADACLRTRAGREFAVASTKAYLAQLAFFLYFTDLLCAHRLLPSRLSDDAQIKSLCAALKKVSRLPQISDEAAELQSAEHVYFLGRGLDYLTAMEASLKLKEITYIHSEAYPAGELKHGTLALVEKGTRVIAFATQSELRERMLGNLCEVKARGAHVTLLTQQSSAGGCAVDRVIALPDLDDVYMPFVSVLPCQRLAFLVSAARGIDCDKPRNLAKSVTVQ